MANEYDLIILGGGCAGLSLARHLVRMGGEAPRTLVLDSRRTYSNDRTWCFWELPGTAALDLVRYRWPRLRVAGPEGGVSVDCASQPYCAIPAHEFYTDALQAIAGSDRVVLQGKTQVAGRVRQEGGRWVVNTSQGSFRADSVVDTRPARRPEEGDALLWQSFLGAEIEWNGDGSDSGEVTLMDFRHTPEHRMVFTYVLPFSATRALVEVTEFSPGVTAPAALHPFLLDALRRVTGGGTFRSLRTESGVLPMGRTGHARMAVPGVARSSTYVQAGVAGGGARACTGYAFQRIQRWAGLCAAELRERQRPLGHPRDPYALQFLDSLFLRVLRDQPDLAPRLFTQLFAGAPTGAVLRFLGDRAGPGDVMRVISALPPGPFLKALGSVCAEPGAAWRELLVS
jgi:lycopene beta-cyclase